MPEIPNQIKLSRVRVVKALAGTVNTAKIRTNNSTKSVRTVRPSSPVIPESPIFAMTEVKPAKTIEMIAKRTQVFIRIALSHKGREKARGCSCATK